MINLALRTEYSFRKTLQHITELPYEGVESIGIADLNGTYGYPIFEQHCNKIGVKPIFGVRLMVCQNPAHREKGKRSGNYGPWYIFIAKNERGIKEIYELVKIAYENFYYHPVIGWIDVFTLSDNVIVIASEFHTEERINYAALCPHTRPKIAKSKLPKVFINDNNYKTPFDRDAYQLYCGTRKSGSGYQYLFNDQTYPQHIMGVDEFTAMFPEHSKEAIENTYLISDICDVKLPKAEIVKYTGNRSIIEWCLTGARKRGIDLENEEYADRLNTELQLIKSKEYGDYFLNVATIVGKAKSQGILVGPSRGSSAGSLVCYLMEITEIDPIPHGLLFARFIDVNRDDLPDIDIDFPDKKRGAIIKNMIKTYGSNNVAHISNIIRFKPKSAINEFGMGIGVPSYQLDAVKNAIIERSGGDARTKMCLTDTLDTTDAGHELLIQYPKMSLSKHVESHAQFTGTHAAGIIICNEPIHHYIGFNKRDNMVQVDKKGAEYLNLLKIDCLGLTALSIIEECCELINMDPQELYTIELDDPKAYQLLNDNRFQGIFQFSGQALQFITKSIGVSKFDDIVAITALARPGAMNSGGTSRYIKYKLGKEEPIYRNEIHKKITEETMGIVIYQETMMSMAKEIGDLSWNDVSTLRKAASKSLGDEFFSKYKNKFISGAIKKHKMLESEAELLWKDISATGSWTFNKSHAVSYALISYWTMYLKAHYPLEFAAATLNNTGTSDSAIKTLRDIVTNEGIEYVPVDPDTSKLYWSIKDDKLIGGLTGIKGIGVKKAREIIKARSGNAKYTPSIVKTLLNPITVFDDIFPCETRYGKLYIDPRNSGLNQPPSLIKDVNEKGEYMVVGRVVSVDLRDRNDYQSVVKRGGEKVTKNQFYLKMFVEDDTDQIMVMIMPQDFDKLGGKELAETIVVDETWFLIKGQIKADWRMININQIFNITNWRPE